jgi:hypothetical protein
VPIRDGLAYNLANFLRTQATPNEIERWSLTPMRRIHDALQAEMLGETRWMAISS